MKDKTVLACVVSTVAGACYITYVTVTHGDGIAFAAICTFLGSVFTGLGVNAYHSAKNKKAVK